MGALGLTLTVLALPSVVWSSAVPRAPSAPVERPAAAPRAEPPAGFRDVVVPLGALRVRPGDYVDVVVGAHRVYGAWVAGVWRGQARVWVPAAEARRFRRGEVAEVTFADPPGPPSRERSAPVSATYDVWDAVEVFGD